MDTDDEADLLRRLQAHERQAFAHLVQNCGPRMLATARRFLSREEDCEDAVQRSFLSAFKSIRDFAGNASLHTWLHRIVVNECLMSLRKRKSQPETSLDSLLPQFDATKHHVQPIATWRSPAEEAGRQETQTLVRRSIEQLPDEYRVVLVLRDIEELSTEEAAEQLGCSPGAVKTRLHRARQALRTLLNPHFAT